MIRPLWLLKRIIDLDNSFLHGFVPSNVIYLHFEYYLAVFFIEVGI